MSPSAMGPPPHAPHFRSKNTHSPKQTLDFSERKGCRVGDQVIALGGLMGFATAIATMPFWTTWTTASRGLELIIPCVATLIPMVLLSVFGAKTHLRQTSGLKAIAGKANMSRVATKYLGFVTTLALLAGAYWLFPEYSKERYVPVWEAAIFVVGPLLPATWFYMLWVDERMSEPHDGYWYAGCLVLGKWKTIDYECLRGYALSWVVKGFFLPFMVSVFATNFGGLTGRGWDLARFDELYISGIQLIYCLDILFGAIGYVLTLRILDSQIRSVQPDLLGWVVTLICYTPFTAALSSFQKYKGDNDWSTMLNGHPVVFITWGFMILCVLTVYVWSTLSFGCRFSNLTNRGIIRSGPYRWMKHPAYVAKNLAWWLMYLPFCAFTTWQDNLRATLMLALLNLIYYMRAKTEEKHLSEEPAYRIYSRWIKRFGLVGTFQKIIR